MHYLGRECSATCGLWALEQLQAALPHVDAALLLKAASAVMMPALQAHKTARGKGQDGQSGAAACWL